MKIIVFPPAFRIWHAENPLDVREILTGVFIISTPRPLTARRAFSSAEPLEVKLCKAYLVIKRRPLPYPSFCTHTSLALSLPLFSAPSSHSPPHPSLPPGPAGPLSGGHRVLTCLHLPPALADQWAQSHGGSLPFGARHSPRVSSSPLFSQPLTPGHGNRGRNVRSDWQDKERSPSRRAQADLRHFHRRTMADLGLDWITDELMTVKRAHRLYISPIISVWRRGVGGVAAVGLVGWVGGGRRGGARTPARRFPWKRERREPRAGP